MLRDTESPAKLWSCDIRLPKDAPEHILLHELIHSCSISHFGIEIFKSNKYAEELSVHYLSQEIAAQKGIAPVESGYDSGVQLIRDFKSLLRINESDIEFASALIKKSPLERWNWLEELIFENVSLDMTVEDYQKMMTKLEEIRQWTPTK